MARCIRCEHMISDAPITGVEHVSEKCSSAPDGGEHEIYPHHFVPGRLDGLCGYIDPDFPSCMCGWERLEDERYVERIHHFLPAEALP